MGSGDSLPRAFDVHAADYDLRWEGNAVARWQRGRVHRAVGRALSGAPGRVLDLGCGTGTDAAFVASLGHRVVGVDASPAMIRAAQVRCPDGEFAVADLRVAPLPDGPFDAAMSNFGALNCLPIAPIARQLADRLRPGAPFVLVLLARTCPAEVIALATAGHLREAVMRRRRAGATVGGVAIGVRYPSAREVQDAFRGAFTCEHREGIGWIAPPPSASAAVGRRAAWDERLGALPGVRRLGDHALYVFRRR